jgi:hypothetical protein
MPPAGARIARSGRPGAPSPPPGRCRPHAQQSAPLTGSSEMMARSAHLHRLARECASISSRGSPERQATL